MVGRASSACRSDLGASSRSSRAVTVTSAHSTLPAHPTSTRRGRGTCATAAPAAPTCDVCSRRRRFTRRRDGVDRNMQSVAEAPQRGGGCTLARIVEPPVAHHDDGGGLLFGGRSESPQRGAEIAVLNERIARGASPLVFEEHRRAAAKAHHDEARILTAFEHAWRWRRRAWFAVCSRRRRAPSTATGPPARPLVLPLCSRGPRHERVGALPREGRPRQEARSRRSPSLRAHAAAFRRRAWPDSPRRAPQRPKWPRAPCPPRVPGESTAYQPSFLCRTRGSGRPERALPTSIMACPAPSAASETVRALGHPCSSNRGHTWQY